MGPNDIILKLCKTHPACWLVWEIRVFSLILQLYGMNSFIGSLNPGWVTYIRHKDRLIIGLRIFSFAKLLTHSSATYSPTMIQQTQQRLLFTIAGKLRSSKFFPSHHSFSFIKCDSLPSGPKRTSLQIARVQENCPLLIRGEVKVLKYGKQIMLAIGTQDSRRI